MLRREDEPNAVARIRKERSPGGHGFQDAAFAFLAQVLVDTAALCDKANQRFRLMRVELVRYDDVAGVRFGVYCVADVGHEICFRTSRPDCGRHNPPSRYLEVRRQAERTVALVLVFLAFRLACVNRDGMTNSLSGLDSGLLVGADDPRASRMQFSRLGVDLAYGLCLLPKAFWVLLFGPHPIFDLVWPDVGLLLKNGPHFVEKLFQRHRA